MRHRTLFRDLGRAFSWHRRKLGVVAAVAAVLSAINAAAPPAEPTTLVVVTRIALSGGAVVGTGDVGLRSLPTGAVPDEAARSTAGIVGRTLVAPVPAGTVLTALSVLSDRTVTDPGQVIAPIRVSDAGVVGLLRVGDRIDLVATDPRSQKSAVVARDVRVVTLPRASPSSGLTAATDGDAPGTGQLVLISVTEEQATVLTGAAGSGSLGVILH